MLPAADRPKGQPRLPHRTNWLRPPSTPLATNSVGALAVPEARKRFRMYLLAAGRRAPHRPATQRAEIGVAERLSLRERRESLPQRSAGTRSPRRREAR